MFKSHVIRIKSGLRDSVHAWGWFYTIKTNKRQDSFTSSLPDSGLSKTAEINRAKYADTAVKMTIDMLLKAGRRKFALKAKLAGGAEMFKFKMTNDLMKIGPRNVAAIKEQIFIV